MNVDLKKLLADILQDEKFLQAAQDFSDYLDVDKVRELTINLEDFQPISESLNTLLQDDASISHILHNTNLSEAAALLTTSLKDEALASKVSEVLNSLLTDIDIAKIAHMPFSAILSKVSPAKMVELFTTTLKEVNTESILSEVIGSLKLTGRYDTILNAFFTSCLSINKVVDMAEAFINSDKNVDKVNILFKLFSSIRSNAQLLTSFIHAAADLLLNPVIMSFIALFLRALANFISPIDGQAKQPSLNAKKQLLAKLFNETFKDFKASDPTTQLLLDFYKEKLFKSIS
ncbi:hypothetical protein [Bacillus sp. 165]|uniref:hypothetical protein n=1 Tax=Bacillus sp. 165 TaxID=1529117 RepID=UPI001ADBAEDB|nr:hypothetical protein [Bacillus sp. 165]MBO9129158.1 hypothetical protein [Bacillus sp. 165]